MRAYAYIANFVEANSLHDREDNIPSNTKKLLLLDKLLNHNRGTN